MISSFDLIAGSLTVVVLLIGYLMAVLTLRRYVVKRDVLLGLSVLLFIALVSPWLSFSIVFILELFSLGSLNHTTFVFLYAWSLPLLGTTWTYITAQLWQSKPKLKYYVLTVFLVLSALFLYNVYVQKDFEVQPVEGSIFYISTFTGMAAYIIYFSVLVIIFFIAPMYYYVALKSTVHKTKVRSALIGTGALLYAILGIVDAAIGLNHISILIIIRFLFLITMFMLYFAYTSPKWFINLLEQK